MFVVVLIVFSKSELVLWCAGMAGASASCMQTNKEQRFHILLFYPTCWPETPSIAWRNQPRRSASTLLLLCLDKNDACDSYCIHFFVRFVLFFIFLSRQRHKKVYIFTKGLCFVWSVYIVHLWFWLASRFLFKKKKESSELWCNLDPKRHLYCRVCVCACVCFCKCARACINLKWTHSLRLNRL